MLIISLPCSFASKKWNEYYNLVNQDIAKVEALKSNDLDLRVRLFELYGEKLSLLLEKENEYKIKYLDTGKSKRLNQVQLLQKRTLSKLELLSKKIERQTRSPKILTKINYYKSLNYYLLKDYKRFFFHIKKAERLNNDPKLEYLINSKLADYYYNENNFEKASRYYKKITKGKDNGWLTKIYYNLAWCELKLKRYPSAIYALKVAYSYEKKKGYFKVGDQLVDAILLFHAISQKTDEGLTYLKSKNLLGFDNLIKYLHYVFESGKRVDIDLVINELNQIGKTSDQKFKLLEKKIITFRPLKRFTLIQKEFRSFKKGFSEIKMNQVKSESRSELKNAIISYTGYLQELVKSKRLISQKTKVRYVRFIADNFGVMKLIDPASSIEYNYYEGETYFSLGQYSRSSSVYANGLKKYKPKTAKAQQFVKKTYDSLFKSLEKETKPNESILLFSLESYLEVFPQGPKAREIHKRLVGYYQRKGMRGKLVSSLSKYNKAFPSDIKIQRDFFKASLNSSIDRKDINSLKELKNLVDKGFLKFPKEESKKLGTVINQLYFAKYDELQSEGKTKKALEGFDSIFKDKSVAYELREEALRKKLFLFNLSKDFESLAREIFTAVKFFRAASKRKYSGELVTYTEKVCSADLQGECLRASEVVIADASFKPSESLKNIYFKIFCINTDDLGRAIKLANSSARKSYLFKILVNKYPGFNSILFNSLYSVPEFKKVIDQEVERRFLTSFYNDLSFKKTKSYFSKIMISNIKENYLRKIKRLESLLGSIQIKFPRPPQSEEISAEQFGNFGNTFNQSLTGIIKNVDGQITNLDPNFVPFFLTVVIKKFKREVQNFKDFVPVSSDENLEKAMNDELAKLNQFLDQKLIEYEQLYYRSIDKTASLSGAMKYRDGLMLKPVRVNLRGISLWQN